MSSAGLEAARALHRPEPTGRSEYVLGEGGVVLGIEPTYKCPILCEPAWYFEGGECATWKALEAHRMEES